MTTYAPNWTPRFKAVYRAAGLTHSVTLRRARGTTAGALIDLATICHDVFDGLASRLSTDFAWIEAAYALTDSDVFVPTDVPDAVTGEFDLVDFNIRARITSTTITGRAATGRARVSLYGFAWNPGGDTDGATDYVVTEAEEPGLADAIDALQTEALAASGEVTLWHRQATIKENDRLLKLVRRGIIS